MHTQRSTHRACVITPGAAYYGDGTVTALRNGTARNLRAILAGVDGRFVDHCTLIVDGAPVEAYSGQGGAVRALGWNHHTIGPWTVFHRSDGRTCAVGIRASMIPHVHFGPLFGADTDPGVVAVMLDRYQQTTGFAWRGTFATTALNGIRLTCGNGDDQPRWKVPRVGRWQGAGRLEWHRPLTELEASWGHVHTFDGIRAYLYAARWAKLAWSDLEHCGAYRFDDRIPGYWRFQLGDVTLAGLADPHRPPILTKVDDQGRAEMTTPMAALVTELDPACVVVDSWLGRAHKGHPAGLRILAPWADQLGAAFPRVRQFGGSVGDVLAVAAKRTYKDAVGGMQRPGMRVERADWGHTIIDGWRATMYRRILAAHEHQGVWPVRVATDSVSYADSRPTPQGRGAAGPWPTLADDLHLAGCEYGCGCARGLRAAEAGFKHESTSSANDYTAWIASRRGAVRRADR